jgi:lipopolysaccharide/colanic/teichoic acid biosynthesis glycosyltransferase
MTAVHATAVGRNRQVPMEAVQTLATPDVARASGPRSGLVDVDPSGGDALSVVRIEPPLSPWLLAPPTLGTRYARVGKPLLDRVGAAVLLVLLSPIAAAVAAVVRVTIGRPLFRQTRVGRFGRPFTVYKFRTMQPDRRSGADRRQTARPDAPDRRRSHKTTHDPRVTTVGRVLRTTSLDEIPQLYNVLRGEMSLVGPRPEMVPIAESYEVWQHHRHLVKPGMTGLWQVTARRAGDVMHRHTDLDLAYVESLSLRTDVRILLKTCVAVVTQRGH